MRSLKNSVHFFLLIICASTAHGQNTQDSSLVGFSFPYLFSLERNFVTGERSFVEAFVAGFPLSSLLFLDTSVRDVGYSETHKIAYTLNAWTFSSGLRYGHKLNSSWALLSELGLLYVHAGANLHLKNISNGSKIPFLRVGASLLQPLLGLSLRKNWPTWGITFSLHGVLKSSLSIQKSGWLPSFQEVAPEYKNAIDDGSDAAEKALTASMNNVATKFNVIPGIAVSYRF